MWYKNKYLVVIVFLKEIYVRKVEVDELIIVKISWFWNINSD